MGGAWASDHKGPNKPDEKAVMSRASRRKETTSDGEGRAGAWGGLGASPPCDLGEQGTGVFRGTACTTAQKVWGAEGCNPVPVAGLLPPSSVMMGQLMRAALSEPSRGPVTSSLF